MQLYRKLAQILPQAAVVVATVVQTKGSVPREVGAKMLIAAQGQTFDTIGGGAGEAKVIQQAQQVLQTGQKQWVEVDLTGSPQNSPQQLRQAQGICGGTMRIWLERWDGEALELVQQILAGLEAGIPLTLVTPLAAQQRPYLTDCVTLDPSHYFVEVLYPDPTLLIVGAGHIGKQLAQVAHLAGFQVAVQDERPEWANAQRYPEAILVANDPIATVLQSLAKCQQLYVALVTRSYHHDLEGLTALLQRQIPCTYIGMMGSDRRIRQVYQALDALGVEAANQLQLIHAPIGLDIGALTPGEIAISIGAELIQVRRCKLNRK